MELNIPIEDPSKRMVLFGPHDENLRLIRSALEVRITARDSTIKISGRNSAVSKAAEVINLLQQRLRKVDRLGADDVADAIAEASREQDSVPDGAIPVYSSVGAIVPRTTGQQAYVDAIRKNDLTVCVGPAGTGKTYLAVALAVSMLRARTIKRIVLVRPAVEAGEKLGYLPGDMQAKVNPYLRPLFDAMHDMMSFDQIRGFMQNDVIEVIPLAFMRGRTLNSAAIILDEAQNTTVLQMLMFLTRLGHHSKMIVTGDDSQIDLDKNQKSGMIDAMERLQRIEGIAIVRLRQRDIVRHRLVQDIVEAYGNGAIDGR
ncbi:MAG: PhoH family protein [Phycisphaerales bacterium]|nr:MAG: PhoH family protein [Phycisphaerales bacterium]